MGWLLSHPSRPDQNLAAESLGPYPARGKAALDGAARLWWPAGPGDEVPSAANNPIIADSVTKLGHEATGRVVVGASHGGVYAAWLGAVARVRGLIVSDAGIGRERAGIAGLAWLDRLGIAAAAVDHDSARIGDGADLMARGRISYVNDNAAAVGCAPGQRTPEAAALMAAAPLSDREAPPQAEARHPIDEAAGWLLDSNGLVRPEDAGTIVVTGSHGGLLGGKPETAIRVDAFAAVYNDAGGGIDDAGFSRLPALDARGIAGATVDAFSARIGDARSTYNDGVISCINRTAATLGAIAGMQCKEFVALMERARRRR